jgi:N-carbamoylputrescine amidase
MSAYTVAAIQMAVGDDRTENLAQAIRLVRRAAAEGANVVLLPELFETPYFCKDHDYRFFDLAYPLDSHPALTALGSLAQELHVVLPVSVFERDGDVFYNTVVVFDADGRRLGHYRKSHIPESPGYHEKFYFAPGNTGFRVFDTRYVKLGVGICWDQWFPEAARAMTLKGAELLLYPTAIGSEPQDPSIDSSGHWTRVMQGHAGANIVPVVAANRTGTENGRANTLTFYGSSFICDHTGAILVQADRSGDAILARRFDTEEILRYRRNWGVLRDRRPDLYAVVARTSADGSSR